MTDVQPSAQPWEIDTSAASVRRLNSRAEQALSWLPLLAAAVLVGLKGSRPLSDPDAWWHLRAGEYVLHHFRLTSPEPWVPFATHTWIMHEWLSQAIAWSVWNLFGDPGLILLRTGTVLLVLLALWTSCRDVADRLPAGIAVVLATSALLPFMTERPQLATFALTSVAIMAWRRSRQDQRLRWWLIPLTWIWACLHGLWIVSPLIGGIAVLGMAADRTVPRTNVLKLRLLVLATFFIGGLTPIGIRLLAVPLEVRAQSTAFISEWAPPSAHMPSFLLVLALVAICVVAALRVGRVAPWSLVLDLVLVFGFALAYERTVALATLVAAPLAAAALQQLRGAPAAIKAPRDAVVPGAIAAVTLAVVAATLPFTHDFERGVPLRLTNALHEVPRGTVIFNAYELGGWLLWTQRQVVPVVDGRNDLYPVSYLQSYATALAVAPGWRTALTRTQAQTALLPANSPLALALQSQLGWVPHGDDEGYVLLIAPGRVLGP